MAILLATFSWQTSFAQLEDGTVYWIQDVATGQFISQGANWGTQATVQEVGGLGLQAVYVSEGVYKLKNIMWNKGNNADLGLRTSDRFLDQAAGDVTLETADGGYKLNTSSGYLCNNGDTNGDGVKRLGSTNEAAAATVWRFLTKSQYDAAIQAYKDGKAASYAASMGYNGVTSVSALEALITDVDQFISKDYTNSINNPTLANNWDGWTHGAAAGSNRSEGAGVGSGCAEFWNGCGYATQTVSGLANGLYKVEFVGTFRPKNSGEANNIASGETSSPAFVYANDAKIEFLHWIDVPAKANGRNGITKANGYGHSFYTYVTDGTLSLGVVQGCWENFYMWCPFGQFTLTYYTDQVADDDITALIATIPTEGTVPASVYSNLTSLKNTLESAKTIAAFNALSEAVIAANTLVSPYAALVAEVAKAKALGVEAATADAYLDGVTTAAEATANTQALMVDEYNYVVENYTTAIDLGAWTTQNAGNMTSQHWDGTSTTSYNEQKEGWSSATAWSTSYTQTITLPAGEYVFKVAGRHSQYSVLTLSVKEGENVIGTVNDFPVGDTGRGINTSGATDFSDGGTYANNGTGRGWQWRYVPFTLEEETSVTISVEGNNPNAIQYQWLSFCNYTVQAKPSLAASKAAYDQAIANANTALESNTYRYVGGTDRSNLVSAVEATPTETIEWYDTQKALVEEYTTVFTSDPASWNAWVLAKNNTKALWGSALDVADPTTAAEAAAGVNALKVAEYDKVNTEYSYPLTTVIGDFTSWTRTAKYTDGEGEHDDIPQTLNKEHWSGVASAYYEQGEAGWGASNGFNCTYTKTATLPAGNYVIKVAARASGSVTGTISATATDKTVALPNVGAASKGIDLSGAANFGEGEFANSGVGYGWEWRFLPFTLAEDGEVTLTINASTTVTHNWFSLADAVLLSDSEKFIPATAEDYTALNTAIEAAAAHTLGFEDGEYAPYNNIEALATLAAAQTIDQNAQNTQEGVQAATAAINALEWVANDGEVNAVYDGTFAATNNNEAPAGWRSTKNGAFSGQYMPRVFNNDDRLTEFNETKSAFFIRFDGTNSDRGTLYYYGDTENYTMPLKANTRYYVKADVKGWGSTGKPQRMNIGGPAGFSGKYAEVTLSNRADNDDVAPQQLFIAFTTTVAGNYTISFQCPGSDDNKHNAVVSNIELKKVPQLALNDEDGCDEAVAYADVTVTRTIKAGAWNSFTVPFDMDVPEGWTVKELTDAVDFGKYLKLEFEDAEAIKAGVPYMVKLDGEENVTEFEAEGVSVSPTLNNVVIEDVVTMKGNMAPTTVPTGAFFISNNTWYEAAEAQPVNIKAFRAYIELSEEATARGINGIFSDLEGDVTGINSVNATEKKFDGTVYDLSGRKVAQPARGLYIVNGKKVVIK